MRADWTLPGRLTAARTVPPRRPRSGGERRLVGIAARASRRATPDRAAPDGRADGRRRDPERLGARVPRRPRRGRAPPSSPTAAALPTGHRRPRPPISGSPAPAGKTTRRYPACTGSPSRAKRWRRHRPGRSADDARLPSDLDEFVYRVDRRRSRRAVGAHRVLRPLPFYLFALIGVYGDAVASQRKNVATTLRWLGPVVGTAPPGLEVRDPPARRAAQRGPVGQRIAVLGALRGHRLRASVGGGPLHAVSDPRGKPVVVLGLSGSRWTGQVMQRGPPRPLPSSEPAIAHDLDAGGLERRVGDGVPLVGHRQPRAPGRGCCCRRPTARARR